MGAVGSYLSIVNDTPDLWYCKIGPDEAALEILNYVGVAIAILGAIATGAAPVALGLSGTVITGLTASSAIAIATNVATVATYAGALGAIAGSIVQETAKAEGMVKIDPGSKFTWGKMSLSLWQQGTCIKSEANPTENMAITMHKLYMRPIFSGATDGSNNDHNIQWWINKWGTQTETYTIQNMDGQPWSTVDVNSELIPVNDPTTTAAPTPSSPGSLLGDWTECNASTDCQNGCCSGKYSDNVLKCSPVGGYKTSEGCVAPGPTTASLSDWEVCTDSNQCGNQCCSGKYSNGELKCTPVGGFQSSEGCVGGATRHLRAEPRKEPDFHDEGGTITAMDQELVASLLANPGIN